MLTQWIRLIQDTTDVSLNNQSSEVIAADGDHTYYLGKRAPFNNFFMWWNVANTNSINMSVHYWDNTEWVSVVDLLDGTFGATQSGVVQFSPNNNNSWQKTEDTSESNAPAALNSFTVYDLYWIRITFDADLSVGSLLNQISYKFTEDADIKIKDIDVDQFLSAFDQTDWLPQILQASLEVANDFRRKKLIKDEGQLLRFDDVVIPTAYKALFIIYLNLGPSYKDRRDEIQKLYEASFKGMYTIDTNSNATEESYESNNSTNTMFR